MRKIFLILTLLYSLPLHAENKIKVMTTIPDIAWAVKQIGGLHVDVKSFLSSGQDPHYADAVPQFVLWASQADVLCKVGLDLEIGWLPKVIEQSANKKIMSAGQGNCDLARYVQVLEVPQGKEGVGRGDVHKYGNPHYWNSPLRLAQGSVEISRVLSSIRPDLKDFFQKNQIRLSKKLKEIHQKNRAKLKKYFLTYQGTVMVQYHKEFVYWAHDHGISTLGAIEEKPGIPPSAGRLASFALEVKKQRVKMIWASKQNNKKILNKFSELSGLPLLTFPVAVADYQDPQAYERIQNMMVAEILKY